MAPEAYDPSDVDTLVSQWDRFGPGLWSDDRHLVFDYLAFLWVRDRLERAIVAADRETASTIRARIAAADNRFREASLAVDPGLATRYRMRDPGWWWRRTPRHPGRSLEPELM
jgi:hypothetical protein